MPQTTDLIASLTTAPDEDRLRELAGLADLLEIRGDLVADLDPHWLREHFSGRLLYTYRSVEEGGRGADGGEERHARLIAAQAVYDLVDLELRDLEPSVLTSIPPEKRLISWHGTVDAIEELLTTVERLTAVEARWYKLVNWVETSGPDRWPLILVKQLGRDDLIAFAAGEVGGWTRLLAAYLGSPAVFAAGSETPAAAGQLPIERLRREYGWPLPKTLTKIFGIVGKPVTHSLSPYIHNRALRALDLPGLYLPFHVESFGEFWLEVVEEEGFTEAGCALRGLSVTAPHKRIAMAVAGATSPLTERIASANTLIYRDGVWEADSTDAEGILGPLKRRQIVVRDRPCAVLGAGGGGRAAAFALTAAGGNVTLFNRSPERGRKAAALLEVPWAPLEQLDPGSFEVVVHSTPLGRDDADPLPCDPSALAAGTVAIDLVYRRREPTPWLSALQERGQTVIDGREVLLHQAIPQFAALTGREMPNDLVVDLLDELAVP